MSANENCPHCGAKIVPSRDADPRETEWRCGTERYVKFLGGFNRSELCRERELRQKAEERIIVYEKFQDLMMRRLLLIVEELLTKDQLALLRSLGDQDQFLSVMDKLRSQKGGAQ